MMGAGIAPSGGTATPLQSAKKLSESVNNSALQVPHLKVISQN